MTHRTLPHHDPAQRAVPHQESGVGHQRAVDRVEVLAEGAPIPRDALLQRFERHALDPGQHPHQVVAVVGLERGNGEATVAADHRGHAMQRRRGQGGVPEDLCIEVRVDVDEAGCDHHAGRIDRALGRPRRRSGFVADGHDAPVRDADVPLGPRGTGAVDDRATRNPGIEHVRSPPVIQRCSAADEPAVPAPLTAKLPCQR